MAILNFRALVQSVNSLSPTVIARRIRSKISAQDSIYVSNPGASAYTVKGLGVHGQSLSAADYTAAPTAYKIPGKSFLPRLREAVSSLCKDLNAGNIQMYDPQEYAMMSSRYPTSLEAMYSYPSAVTAPVTLVLGTNTTNNVTSFVCTITANTGVTPKTGDYEYYGASCVTYTLKLGTTDYPLTCAGYTDSVITLTSANSATIIPLLTNTNTPKLTIQVPGFSASELTYTFEEEEEEEDDPAEGSGTEDSGSGTEGGGTEGTGTDGEGGDDTPEEGGTT